MSPFHVPALATEELSGGGYWVNHVACLLDRLMTFQPCRKMVLCGLREEAKIYFQHETGLKSGLDIFQFPTVVLMHCSLVCTFEKLTSQSYFSEGLFSVDKARTTALPVYI